MAQTRIDQAMFVNGNLGCSTFTPPSGCITDDAVIAQANVATSKLKHRNWVHYAQESTANAAVERRIIYRCNYAGGGTILKFGVGAVTPAAAAGNAVVRLLKNGATILTANITLDSTTAAYILKEPAGFTSTALVAADVLEIEVVSVAATIPKGLYFSLLVDEFAN